MCEGFFPFVEPRNKTLQFLSIFFGEIDRIHGLQKHFHIEFFHAHTAHYAGLYLFDLDDGLYLHYTNICSYNQGK